MLWLLLTIKPQPLDPNYAQVYADRERLPT